VGALILGAAIDGPLTDLLEAFSGHSIVVLWIVFHLNVVFVD
jgi:hypothetical protein